MCPCSSLLVVGERPFAGGMSTRSTNWSDRMRSTRCLSRDGRPGAATMDFGMLAVDGRGLVNAGVVMPAARPRVDKEAAGGMMPKVVPIKPVGNGPEPTYLSADS